MSLRVHGVPDVNDACRILKENGCADSDDDTAANAIGQALTYAPWAVEKADEIIGGPIQRIVRAGYQGGEASDEDKESLLVLRDFLAANEFNE